MSQAGYYDLRLVDVSGFHVVSSKRLLQIENAQVSEVGVYDLLIKSFYGIGHGIEKTLRENPSYFEDKEVYALFTQDGLTFQCVNVKKVKVTENKPSEFTLMMTLTVPLDHQKNVIQFLKEQAYHDAMYEKLTEQMEKTVAKHIGQD